MKAKESDARHRVLSVIGILIGIFLIGPAAFGGNIPGVSVGHPLPTDTSPAAYCGQNPFFNAGYGGQCTSFCWGRAKEKLGINTLPTGNAQDWLNAAQVLFQTGSVAQANSIAVWSYTGGGHVAFVEDVIGNQVIFNEANVKTYKNTNWGGGYDGVDGMVAGPKTLSTTAMVQRQLISGNTTVLLGYIYLGSNPSQQALLTFDDLADTAAGLNMPAGYGGLNWNNFGYLDAVANNYNPSGYPAAIISPKNVAFNWSGSPAWITASQPFNFNSAYLTAAWRDNLQVKVLGYVGNTLVYSNTYTLSTATNTLINCNYLRVDEVYFNAFGGTAHSGYNSSGEQFAMDNVTVVTNLAPQITTQPNNQDVNNGATVTFVVAAVSGLPVNYQWQKNGVNMTDGITIAGSTVSGSTYSTLTIANISAYDVGTYSVAVSNAFGSVTSIGATLTTSGSALLTFEGLQDEEPIDNYYRSGFGGFGSGPGPNYGITFTSDSLALISRGAGGSGNVDNNPSGDTVAFFLNGAGDTMNVAGGFTGGFWFYYSAPYYPGLITVWSGPNGTGTQLASVVLPMTPVLPGPYNYDDYLFKGVTFSGKANSVVFGGTQNYIVFDNITLGNSAPTSGSALSNVRAQQQTSSSLVDIYYDLSGASAPVFISVSISTNGGNSYDIQSVILDGDGVSNPIATGNNYHLIWIAGADMPNSLLSKVRVRITVPGGASFAQAVSNIFPLDTRNIITGALTGRVLSGGSPLANAQVSVENTSFTTKTMSDGTFTLSMIPVGNGYVLNIAATGYTSARLTGVNVTAGGNALGSIKLTITSGPYRLIPLVPDVNPAITTVEEGGTAYRYYYVVNSSSSPQAGIAVAVQIAGGAAILQNDVSNYWPGQVAGISDANGIVRISIPALVLGTVGTVQTAQVSASGKVQQTFQAQVLPRQYDQVWKQKLAYGGSVDVVGANISPESTIRHTIVGGATTAESVSRVNTTGVQVGPGAGVDAGLSLKTTSVSFSGEVGVSAGIQLTGAVVVRSTYTFTDPNSTDPGQNAMKLYLDLGNILFSTPGPQMAFYEFAKRTIEPSFIGSYLSSVEGDVRVGPGAQGQVGFEITGGKQFLVGSGGNGSVDEEAIGGFEQQFGTSTESAVIDGVIASGSASIDILTLPQIDVGSFIGLGNAETLTKNWTYEDQNNSYKTEKIVKLSLDVDKRIPVAAWQQYDPQALYSSYQRDFTETVEQSKGATAINYEWKVYAAQQNFGLNFNLDLVAFGVYIQGELDQGAEAVNQRGAILQSRHWPTESYPAITATYLPNQSWGSILSHWGYNATGPIGQALNQVVTTVAGVGKTIIHDGQAVLTIAGGALSTGAKVVTTGVSLLFSHLRLSLPRPLNAASVGGITYLPPDGTSNYVYGIGGIYRYASTNVFSGTATLSITYSNADVMGLNPTDLRIYQLPDGTNCWQLVGGTVNTVSNTVTVTITKLGTFAVAPPLPTGTLQLIPSTNALPADGITQMSVVVSNIILNTGAIATQQWLFTATVTGVQLLNADADANIQGTQVVSTNGTVTLLLQAPSGGTVAHVSLTSVAGDAYGTVAINIIDTTPPATPTGVSVSAGQSRIWVSWAANTEPDLAGYRVYYREGQNGPPYDGTATVEGMPSPAQVSGTNVLLRGLAVGSNYFVAVSALDTTGNESPLSSAVQVTTANSPPSPPTTVAARFGQGGTNVIMWALSEDDGYNDRDVVRYDIFRAVLPSGTYVKVAGVNAGIGLYIEATSNVPPSQHIGYAVTAVNSMGLSSPQVPAYVTPPTVTVALPMQGQLWSNAMMMVTGTANDNSVLTAVWCQLNESGWSQATTTNGWNGWMANVRLTPGTNIFRAYAIDIGGGISVTNSSVVVYIPSHPLVFASSPAVTNALLCVQSDYIVVPGETNLFTVGVIDPDGNPLSYKWNFGDGDTTPWLATPTAMHAYAATNCGPYTATVIVTDNWNAPSRNLAIITACQLAGTKLQVGLNFSKAGSDSASLTAKFNLQGITSVTQLNGRSLLVDIGDVQAPFTFDNKGRGVSSSGTCRLVYTKPTKTKLGYWTTTIALSKGSWHNQWANHGLDNASHKGPGKPVMLPVALLIGGEAFAAEPTLHYTAILNKTGTAK